MKNRLQPPPLDLPFMRFARGRKELLSLDKEEKKTLSPLVQGCTRGDFRGVLEDGNLDIPLLSAIREVSLLLGFPSRASTRTTPETISRRELVVRASSAPV
jgi:hypothetical protein